MRFFTLLTSLLLFATTAAFSATYHVQADGSGDFPTIQAALTGAIGGDTVMVGDGSYSVSNLDFGGKAIVLMSQNGFQNCILDGGGRVFVFGSGETTATIVDGFSIRNGSASVGGAIFIQGASPTFVNNQIRDNYAEDLGGAIYITSTSAYPVFINNIIENNEAVNEGGGIYNDGGHPVLYNNTIVFNEAPFGAGMRFDGLAGVTVSDNIFWGNFWGGQVAGGISGTFTNNLIEGWSGTPVNFDGNPNFASGPDGNRYLGAGSDALDAGSVKSSARCYTTGRGTLCMENMTTSTTRTADTGILDVGFHYGPLPRTITVPGDFATIQAALDDAWNGDTVQLLPGNHDGPGNRDLDFRGKAVTLRGDPDHTADCTIACEGSAATPRRGIHFHSGEGPDTVIEGLTIHGGYAADSGGGVLCEGSSPTFRLVEIIDCEAAVDGGGMACVDYSSPVIDRCSIGSNDAGDDGGGLFARNFSSPDIDDSSFNFNRAGSRGGGALFVVNSFPTVDGCTFYTNTAAQGAGIAFTYAFGPVTDCIIESNWASETGGGIQCYGNAQCVFTRCTIVRNHAVSGGVGVWCRNNSSPSFQNTIIAFNYPGLVFGRFDDDCNPTFGCCDIYGNPGGNWVGFLAGWYRVDGNFSGDPYFCNLDTDNFYLDSVSMCSAAQNPACGQIGYYGVNCSVAPVEEDLAAAPASRLISCSPNPFNPATKVVYQLSTPGAVDLRVYDLAGRLIKVLKAGAIEQPGRRDVPWDGRDGEGRPVSAGVYVVRLEVGSQRDVMRVALVK